MINIEQVRNFLSLEDGTRGEKIGHIGLVVAGIFILFHFLVGGVFQGIKMTLIILPIILIFNLLRISRNPLALNGQGGFKEQLRHLPLEERISLKKSTEKR